MCNTSTQQSSAQQTTYTPTDTEKQILANNLTLQNAALPGQMNMNALGMGDVSTLLAGGTLPGNLGKLSTGIDTNAQNYMANQAVNSANAGLNAQGLADSGVGAVARARTAGDIYSSAAQFNIQTLQQLLNQGIGGQASVQSPILTGQGQNLSALAGLRGISTTGTSTTTANPFLNSLYGAAGNSFGGGNIKFNIG